MEYLLDESWKDIDRIIPYGYGRVGKRVLPKLKEMLNIPFVIDNNPIYKEKKDEIKIVNQAEGLRQRTKEKIVVLTVETAYADIKDMLEKEGLEENKDFCVLERFLGEWSLRYKNQCVLSKVDIVLTFRCTLNCNHCAMFTIYGERKEYNLSEIKENINKLFIVVDYVLELTLLGGEPIIHRSLIEVLGFIKEKYSDRIGQVVLITNGNVNPSEEVYDIIKDSGTIISISDYTLVHNYKNELDSFVKRLKKHSIPYYYNREMEWKDHGYPGAPKDYSDEDAPDHVKKCGHTTHSMNEGKLYYCDAMYGAEVNTGFKTAKDDILDFDELIKWKEPQKAKERVISYCFGDINEKGFPSFCKVCGGIGHDNHKVIRAGE